MKILIATSEFDPFRGGIGTYVRELAMGATELGHEVTVFAPDYGSRHTELDSGFPFKIIRYRGGVSSIRGLPSRVIALRKLSRSSENFDIVHAACWPFYIPLALSKFRGRARCILTFHGTEVNLMVARHRAWLLQAVGFWKPWSELVCNSRFTEALLKKRHPKSGRSIIRAVPLAVASDWAGGRPDRASARAHLGIASTDRVIVSLGRLAERKGHLVLAKALVALPRELRERVKWIIVGAGRDPEYLRRLKEAVEALGERAMLAGKLHEAELKQVLAAGDLFCLPGFQDDNGEIEGFGLAYLEAGAFGLPAVATNVGGVPDAVDDQVTGVLVPPLDVPALGAALQDLLLDDKRRAAMGRAAEERAAASSWKLVAARTYESPNGSR